MALHFAICATPVAAQAVVTAKESVGSRAILEEAQESLARGDLDRAQARYSAAYAQAPSAEAQLGLGRLACARSNFGDCRAWLRAALAAQVLPLDPGQRELAESLLRAAEQLVDVRPTVVVLAPPQPTRVEVRLEPAPQSLMADRDRLWTAVSVVLVSVLAGTLVAIGTSGS